MTKNMIKFFKKFQDLAVTGKKAIAYDKLTREHRMDEIKKQANDVAKYLKNGDSVLEVAPGAGYLAIEIAKLGNYKITGLDISDILIEICKQNALKANVKNINFQQGNVSDMPFPDNKFNFIVCVLSFKNFKEPVQALKEMYRVLKPGGMVLIMDLNGGASLKATKKVAENMGLKGIMAYIAGAVQRSAAYNKEELENFISSTKFKDYEIQESDMGFSIYLKK